MDMIKRVKLTDEELKYILQGLDLKLVFAKRNVNIFKPNSLDIDTLKEISELISKLKSL